jgi:hypothetical protein
MYKIMPYESVRTPLIRTSILSLTYIGKMKLNKESGRNKKRSKKAILLEMHFLPLCIHKHDARIDFSAEKLTTELQWRELEDLRFSQTLC